MIDGVQWRGDVNGTIVLNCTDPESGRRDEIEIDRPGDLVTAIMTSDFASEEMLAAAGAYGVCIASRGISEPAFIRPIVDKTVPFVASADPSSVLLVESLARLRGLAATSELEGRALRERLLEEAHRLRANLE